jgi:hypothetical protein
MGHEDHQISRRTALKILGGTGLMAGFGPRMLGQRPIASAEGRTMAERLAMLQAALGDLPHVEGSTLAPSLQVYAYRREDLLNIRFDLYNLELDVSDNPPMLVPIASGSPSWLVAVFPFQSIAEYAKPVGAKPPSSWPQTPVESLASGPSQLAFSVPASGIPYTLASLTDWQALSALLPAVSTSGGTVAATDPTGAPTSTSPPLTYVEMAWQLLVAPDESAVWVSPAAPVANGTWTELWQARLTPSSPLFPTEIYAVWTPGFSPTGSSLEIMTDPFNTSLTDQAGQNTYRTGLVALSSRASINESEPQNGIPAAAKMFMLTPLGVTADVQGGPYSDIVASDIESWTHKMSVGRDTYVRIVLAGYLYPFGNRASLIQTTDREFQVSPSGDTVAYLVERTTVQVTQPIVSYPYPETGAAVDPDGGRQNPFVSIEVKTLTTPPTDPTSSTTDTPKVVLSSPHVSADNALWINVDGSPFPFAFVGTDAEGRTVDFSAWGIWVSEEAFSSSSETWVNDVVKNYTAKANLPWRSPSMGGQLLAFAPPSSQPGATALHVDSLVFDTTDWITNSSESSPPWYLNLSQTDGAMVRLPAVAALTATDGDDPATGSQIVYESTTYLPDGFPYPAGVPEVFLTFLGSTPLNFTQAGAQASQTGTSQSGGVAAPNFNIDGFARDLGPVSDSATLLTGAFNAKTFFAGLDAKILGAVPLTDIIQAVTGGPIRPADDGPDAGSQAPTIHSVPIYQAGQTAPVALKTTIDWTPAIQSGTTTLPGVFTPDNPDGSGLTIHAQLYAPLDPPGPPTSNIDGELSNFTLTLFGSAAGVIALHFTNVQFSQRTGSKSNVQVNIDTVEFIGALSFIEAFEELFSSLGGPQIDVEPSGITASYTVSLPSIGLGVFALENISLGGTLNIPFTGQPVRLTVNFCTRENPFLLTIFFFTGGGWFAISLGADGIELVEVGLEFGASISLDLGVASGGVTVAVGIYFALGSNTVTLTGFFQASGNLEVLGIISISIVFYLALTYQSPPGDAYGTASVSVTVSVLCFSASVTLTVTKQISSGDPTIPFAQAISATDWSNYCASFA